MFCLAEQYGIVTTDVHSHERFTVIACRAFLPPDCSLVDWAHDSYDAIALHTSTYHKQPLHLMLMIRTKSVTDATAIVGHLQVLQTCSSVPIGDWCIVAQMRAAVHYLSMRCEVRYSLAPCSLHRGTCLVSANSLPSTPFRPTELFAASGLGLLNMALDAGVLKCFKAIVSARRLRARKQQALTRQSSSGAPCWTQNGHAWTGRHVMC